MNKRLGRLKSDYPDEPWEARLRATARAFPYPPTPDIAGAVSQRLRAESGHVVSSHRRLAWGVVTVLIILGGLMAVPQVRAAVVEFLQIGAIRVILAQPSPTPAPSATASLLATSTGLSSSVKPRLTSTPVSSVLELAGEMTLAEAQAQVDFPIRLPSYPPDLGPPDRVFLQDLAGPVVVLVWVEPDHPDQALLSLHQLGPDTFAQKLEPLVVLETSVNGQPALWTEGPYLLQFERDDGAVVVDTRRLVRGHVLIWVEEEITYRLETDESLEEAIHIAESLR